MHITIDETTRYLSENFVLDEEMLRLCYNVIRYAEEMILPESKEDFLIEIFSAIGFGEDDISSLRQQGIIYTV